MLLGFIYYYITALSLFPEGVLFCYFSLIFSEAFKSINLFFFFTLSIFFCVRSVSFSHVRKSFLVLGFYSISFISTFSCHFYFSLLPLDLRFLEIAFLIASLIWSHPLLSSLMGILVLLLLWGFLEFSHCFSQTSLYLCLYLTLFSLHSLTCRGLFLLSCFWRHQA